jgi:hypothetical protein
MQRWKKSFTPQLMQKNRKKKSGKNNKSRVRSFVQTNPVKHRRIGPVRFFRIGGGLRGKESERKRRKRSDEKKLSRVRRRFS